MSYQKLSFCSIFCATMLLWIPLSNLALAQGSAESRLNAAIYDDAIRTTLRNNPERTIELFRRTLNLIPYSCELSGCGDMAVSDAPLLRNQTLIETLRNHVSLSIPTPVVSLDLGRMLSDLFYGSLSNPPLNDGDNPTEEWLARHPEIITHLSKMISSSYFKGQRPQELSYLEDGKIIFDQLLAETFSSLIVPYEEFDIESSSSQAVRSLLKLIAKDQNEQDMTLDQMRAKLKELLSQENDAPNEVLINITENYFIEQGESLSQKDLQAAVEDMQALSDSILLMRNIIIAIDPELGADLAPFLNALIIGANSTKHFLSGNPISAFASISALLAGGGSDPYREQVLRQLETIIGNQRVIISSLRSIEAKVTELQFSLFNLRRVVLSEFITSQQKLASIHETMSLISERLERVEEAALLGISVNYDLEISEVFQRARHKIDQKGDAADFSSSWLDNEDIRFNSVLQTILKNHACFSTLTSFSSRIPLTGTRSLTAGTDNLILRYKMQVGESGPISTRNINGFCDRDVLLYLRNISFEYFSLTGHDQYGISFHKALTQFDRALLEEMEASSQTTKALSESVRGRVAELYDVISIKVFRQTAAEIQGSAATNPFSGTVVSDPRFEGVGNTLRFLMDVYVKDSLRAYEPSAAPEQTKSELPTIESLVELGLLDNAVSSSIVLAEGDGFQLVNYLGRSPGPVCYFDFFFRPGANPQFRPKNSRCRGTQSADDLKFEAGFFYLDKGQQCFTKSEWHDATDLAHKAGIISMNDADDARAFRRGKKICFVTNSSGPKTSKWAILGAEVGEDFRHSDVNFLTENNVNVVNARQYNELFEVVYGRSGLFPARLEFSNGRVSVGGTAFRAAVDQTGLPDAYGSYTDIEEIRARLYFYVTSRLRENWSSAFSVGLIDDDWLRQLFLDMETLAIATKYLPPRCRFTLLEVGGVVPLGRFSRPDAVLPVPSWLENVDREIELGALYFSSGEEMRFAGMFDPRWRADSIDSPLDLLFERFLSGDWDTFLDALLFLEETAARSKLVADGQVGGVANELDVCFG